MVRAYVMLVESECYGEPVNIGTGKGHTISEVTEVLIEVSGVNVTLESDPALMRPADVPRLICDSRKMREATGWEPKIPFEQTMKDLFDYWLRRLSNNHY